MDPSDAFLTRFMNQEITMEETVVKSQNTNVSRLFYCDYLRVFAAFSVIVIHACAQYWNDFDINSLEWFVLNGYEGITRWAVPVFVMISGALLLNKEIPLKRIYSRYVLHLLCAFAFWSIFYCIFNRRTWPDLCFYLLVGNHHMWYVAMIIGLYICIPFIRKITDSASLCTYYLVLWFVFSSLIPFVADLTSFSASDAVQTLRAGLLEQMDNMHLGILSGYAGYFILGFCLNRLPFDRKARLLIYALGILGTFSAIALNLYFSVYMQSRIGAFFGSFSVTILLQAAAVFIWFRYNVRSTGRLNAVMAWISRHCFGIYLIHAFILDVLDHGLGLNTLSFHPAISVPLISCIVFVLSLLLSWLISKIPAAGKWII